MKIKHFILLLLPLHYLAQNTAFSPYTRYGLGEMVSPTFMVGNAMGGAFTAYKPDSTAPTFLNAGNPAAYPLIRFTTFEAGGTYRYSDLSNANSGTRKWGTNFSYAALGFPVRQKGGAVIGIQPYSFVGYDMKEVNTNANSVDVTGYYQGSGGLSKAFIGYGVMPFQHAAVRYKRALQAIPDSLLTIGREANRFRYFMRKAASDLSFGANVGWLFGSLEQTDRLTYPSSTLYNYVFRQRLYTFHGLTYNFGIQGAFTIDSVHYKKDSLLHRRALKQRFRVTYGAYMNVGSSVGTTYDDVALTYILNTSGQEIVRDTLVYNVEKSGSQKLPAEIGIGLGFKKGERLQIVVDAARTSWKGWLVNGVNQGLTDNLRLAVGVNYVPDKDAAGKGVYARRMQYRFGAQYQSGYISIRNTNVPDYSISVGAGLPIGYKYVSSMVNVFARVGVMGSTANNLVMEKYFRFGVGFTFTDRWFQKFRYD